MDAVRSVRVELRFVAGKQAVALTAWCRVGVWTTLERVRTQEFLLRESWGRLGSRPPRILARIEDELVTGVRARVRPHADGSLEFRLEASEGSPGPLSPVAAYHGRTVALSRASRRGYRFTGVAPPHSGGLLARWGDVLAVYRDPEGPGRAAGWRFQLPEGEGFVAGRAPSAETFAERWLPVAPVQVRADGVERADFRLVPHERSAGFQVEKDGTVRCHGPDAASWRAHPAAAP